MLKELLTITIEAPSHHEKENSRLRLIKVVEEEMKHINNGSRIRLSTCNAKNTMELTALIGKIKWWSIDRTDKKPFEHETPKKTIWRKFLDGLGEVWEGEYSSEGEKS